MIGSIIGKISKKSYYKSFYLHLSFVLFVVIPIAYLVPQYLDSGVMVSTGEVKLITISEQDYEKIVNKTKQTTSIAPTQQIKTVDLKEPSLRKLSKQKKTPQPPKPKKAIQKTINNPSNKTKILPNPAKAPASSTSENIHNDSTNSNDSDTIDLNNDPIQSEEKIKNTIDSFDVITDDNQKTTIFGTAESVISEDISISIKDILAVQINKCWNEYYNEDSAVQNFVVIAVIGFRQNGTVNKIDIERKFIIDQKINDAYESMVQNVKKAIMNCSPIKGLPINMFNEWQNVKINFRHGKKNASN